MVTSLKLVTSSPVVVLVVVAPPVTASAPTALLSVPCRTVQVTEGVDEPTSTARISVIVIALFVKNADMSSELVGSSIVIDLLPIWDSAFHFAAPPSYVRTSLLTGVSVSSRSPVWAAENRSWASRWSSPEAICVPCPDAGSALHLALALS